MSENVLETLFTVFYGLSFGWMGTQMLKDIFPLGIGVLIHEGVKSFIVRLSVVLATFVISALFLVSGLRLCLNIQTYSYITEATATLVILQWAISPWLAYHFARVLLRPIARNLYVWQGVILNVDVLFILCFGSGFCVTWSMHKLMEWLHLRSG